MTHAALAAPASAQVEFGGLPPSAYDPLLANLPTTLRLDPVDVDALLLEDELRTEPGPFRFGAELPVRLDPETSGEWATLDDGTRVWRLRITSPGAHSLSFLFDAFALPVGAELYVYDDERATLRGQYNASNNKPDGRFAIQPTAGDTLTLEYVEPVGASGGALSLAAVVHDYRDVLSLVDELLGKAGVAKASGSCNNDVNCPEGAPWQNIKRSVALIFIGGGACTGSLINNTANDGDQLFITANHCGNMNSAVFRFNYEKAGCGTGSAPTNMSVQGSQLLSASSSGDRRLVRIIQAIPAAYNVHYQGWDRTDGVPASTVAIHHPQADVKKISFDFNPPSKSGGDWRINQWDDGVTEPGSSGSPLYSNEGLFIGALFGGQATCSYPYNDYYPRFANNFPAFSTWLDPLGSGATKLPGVDAGAPPPACGLTKLGVGLGGANIAVLDSGSTPKLGATFRFDLSGFNGSASGLMLLDIGAFQQAVLGGTLFVDYLTPALVLPVAISAGKAMVPLTLPSTPGLAYVTAYAQAGAPDASQAFGWALTNGLAITFCP